VDGSLFSVASKLLATALSKQSPGPPIDSAMPAARACGPKVSAPFHLALAEDEQQERASRLLRRERKGAVFAARFSLAAPDYLPYLRHTRPLAARFTSATRI
jgi:hypothetical protein